LRFSPTITRGGSLVGPFAAGSDVLTVSLCVAGSLPVASLALDVLALDVLVVGALVLGLDSLALGLDSLELGLDSLALVGRRGGVSGCCARSFMMRACSA
jgi:hypothetical protein